MKLIGFFYINEACKSKAYQITYALLFLFFLWKFASHELYRLIVTPKQKVICKSKLITLLTSPVPFPKSIASWINNSASRTVRKSPFLSIYSWCYGFCFVAWLGFVCVCWLFKYFSLFLQFQHQQDFKWTVMSFICH